jgi:serine/threonine protein kinase
MDEESIFAAALEMQSLADRDSYLDVACRGNAQLRADVEELLRCRDHPDNVFESPPWAVAEPLDNAVVEQPGSVIGRYELIDQIGEGGMGVVFMAEQTTPVKRRVALKIIKPGMDTRQVIARFEAERQALALMDHPNIAKVLDAGTTEGDRRQATGVSEDNRPSGPSPVPRPLSPTAGRPYFVMELVHGVPITDYCDECHLTTKERLGLFVTVCQAVQHAHQKGIIHRDLKPTNVLVAIQDGNPTPKIIDFGVAKAIGEQSLTERTLTTAFAQMVGTPLYMSPEQAELSALGVDTRSDIYSLGVLLYELLTSATPFDKDRLHSASYDELRRIIREEEPPRPSARISTIAAELATTVAERRRTDIRRLRLAVRGELDWIVMKCLEKDRNRRYETASALAVDISHYLADEPVSAGAPSRVYRAGKFVRRNKAAVIASAAVLLGLVAGIIGTTIGLVSQSRQRAIAERERAEVQFNYAIALESQRKYAEAEALYRQGLTIPVGDTPAERQRAAHMSLRLAETVSDRGGAAESERFFREALASYRDAFPPGDPNVAHVLTQLASVLRTQQQFVESESLFHEAYEIHRHAKPVDHRLIGESATNLANVQNTLGRYAEAEPLARQAVAEQQQAVPEDPWGMAMARLELGRSLIAAGKFPDAETELVEVDRALARTHQFHFGPMSLAALYTAWDQAEPGKGYDVKADDWLRNLMSSFIRLETTTHAGGSGP